MRPDPKIESMHWLKQAISEFKDAKLLYEHGRYYLALYLSQQSTEKALRGFLIFLGESNAVIRSGNPPHSIHNLIMRVLKLDTSMEFPIGWERLDDYYIKTRYPNELPGYDPSEYYNDPEEVETALQIVEKIISSIRKKMDVS